MPRKLRVPKRRTAAVVSRALRHLLTWNDFHGARELALEDSGDATELYALQMRPSHERETWHAIEVEAVADWAEDGPGTRPAMFWRHSAPDLRLVIGPHRPIDGISRCTDTGVPYFVALGRGRLTIETEAGWLDRHDAWLPGERRRTPADAFEPAEYGGPLEAA